MCIRPSKIWIERGPSWEQVPVPCKKCWRCRSNRVNDYVGRALCEAAFSDWTLTLTLTYAPRDDLADKVLTPKHFQNAMRSFRRRGHSIRYLVAGEYGELRGRCHFHAILFGQGKRPEIPHKRNHHIPEWPHGHVFGDWGADEKALRYTCKYLLDNIPGRYWFSLSKKPTLGAAFFYQKALKNVELGVTPSTFEYLPPGGHRGRPYLMTGATRRDYLATIFDLAQRTNKKDKAKLSEWVLKSLEKHEFQAAVSLAESQPVKEQMERHAETLERLRPSARAVTRSLLDTSHVWQDTW